MLEILPGENLRPDLDLMSILSHSTSPIALVDGLDKRFVYVNKRFAALFPEVEFIDLTLNDLLFPLTRENIELILPNVLQKGEPFQKHIILPNAEGSLPKPYNFIFSPYCDDCGKPAGLMIMVVPAASQVVHKADNVTASDFGNIVYQFTDPILILKGDEMIIDIANDALLDLWNVTKDALGKPLLDILPEMKEQGFYDLLLDVYHNGKTHYGFETEFSFKRNGKSGIHYFNFIYQPYRDKNSTIRGIMVVASDVTSQVNAKRQLASTELNIQNMILQAPVAICILKGEDYIVEIANERMFEIWGRTEKEVSGKPVFEALPEARGQGLEQLLNEVLKTGDPFYANERPVQLPRKNGIETRYLNFVYAPFINETNVNTGIIAVATDVTDQVIARQKIEYAEESARLAIDSAQLGSYEVNLVTNEVKVSKRFSEIWDMDGEITDRSEYASRIHPEDKAIRESAHKASISTGVIDYEARIIRRDKSITWVKVRGKVIKTNNGEPLRLLGVVQDITEHKEAAELLSRNIESRTEQLKEANEQLKKSNEELEQFAYIASHDLQEPLRKIQFFTNSALQETNLTDPVKKYLEKVNSSGKRMTDLIRGLLEYSRLSHKTPYLEKVDLNELVRNVMIDFELLISQKNADVQIENLPVIRAIPLQMNQLFFNLLGNALKFSKRNVTPVIRITGRELPKDKLAEHPSLDPDKKYCEITVQDNGIGFSEEYAEKIFTIFQRLNERTMYAGYGIGLAVCRKIADNHNGVIFASGKSKEGASFTCILPYNNI